MQSVDYIPPPGLFCLEGELWRSEHLLLLRGHFLLLGKAVWGGPPRGAPVSTAPWSGVCEQGHSGIVWPDVGAQLSGVERRSWGAGSLLILAGRSRTLGLQCHQTPHFVTVTKVTGGSLLQGSRLLPGIQAGALLLAPRPEGPQFSGGAPGAVSVPLAKPSGSKSPYLGR